MIYEFDRCVLDTATQELTRDTDAVHVEPQVLAVLEYLAANRDRVVTKIELLDEVWGDRFVSETALTSRIKLARKACGDSGREQRVIATVHGRGYRFVADTVERVSGTARRGSPAATTGGTGGRAGADPAADGRVVGAGAAPGGASVFGRAPELEALQLAATDVEAGHPRFVFVTGESGVGKSTLVAEFVERHDGFEEWYVLRGRCLRARGVVEPYFALLDALGTLARNDPRALVGTLEHAAPAWLAQLPMVIDDELAERLQRRLLGDASGRMLREGADAFEQLATRRPVLLVVEDLQWADDATLDVLDLLVQRASPVPLLVVCTARSGAARAAEVVAAAVGRGGASELRLGTLGPGPLEELACARLGAEAVAPEVTDVMADRSGGVPLFAQEILSSWERDGRIRVDRGRAVPVDPADDLGATVPVSLVPLIEQPLAELDAVDLAVLETAAVSGPSFDSAAVAAGAGLDPGDVDARLAAMARRLAYLGVVRGAAWPDGTVGTRYAFAHELYREVLHDRVPASRRAEVHARVGEALERGFGNRAGEIAAQLAEHFVLGGDRPRAVEYLRLAGEQAAARNAHDQAAVLFGDALEGALAMPEGASRDEAELRVRMSYGPTLVATRGWFDEEVAGNYSRAVELCADRGPCAEAAAARYGLATVTELRGEFERTEALLTPLLELEATGDLAMEAHELLACSTFHQGAFDRSLHNADMVLESWDEDAYSVLMSRIAEHPASSCNSWASLANWGLGHSALSLRQAERAVELGEENTYALSTAIAQRAMLHQLRGEPEECVQWATRAREVAREQDFPMRMIQADLFRGWGLGTGGSGEEGLRLLTEGLGRFRDAGARLNEAYYLGLHADVLLHVGDHRAALGLLEEAVERMGASRSYFFGSELQRLTARALLGAEPSEADAGAVAGAREALDRAAVAARDRESPVLALRVALDRHDLEALHGDPAPWLARVAELASALEDTDTSSDAVRARALLGP